MSLFDEEKDVMLIQLVRGKRVIYDSSHPQHRNIIAKHTEWKKISTAMGIPIADIQKRWKHFRDHYKKKKKLKSKKNTWRYMHLLEFLSAPSKLSKSEHRRKIEEQRKALSQEPQTPELSDISIFSFENLEDAEARSETLLLETGSNFTSNIPESISPMTRKTEYIQTRKPESESSLSLEACAKMLTRDVKALMSTEKIPKVQDSSNSEHTFLTNIQPVDKFSESNIRIRDSHIHRYFALIAEITTMFPPHLVSDLKLRIHKSIYQIELEWQKEKREKKEGEIEKSDKKKREREERKNINRLIALHYRQLNLS